MSGWMSTETLSRILLTCYKYLWFVTLLENGSGGLIVGANDRRTEVLGSFSSQAACFRRSFVFPVALAFTAQVETALAVTTGSSDVAFP